MNTDSRILINGGGMITALMCLLGVATGENTIVVTGCALAGASLAMGIVFDWIFPA